MCSQSCVSSICRELDGARRRKWVRTRAPKPLPLDDPFRKLYVTWEVTATPHGRLEVTVTMLGYHEWTYLPGGREEGQAGEGGRGGAG